MKITQIKVRIKMLNITKGDIDMLLTENVNEEQKEMIDDRTQVELINTRTQAKHYEENFRKELLKASFQDLDEECKSKILNIIKGTIDKLLTDNLNEE